jgi:hypothetical protein
VKVKNPDSPAMNRSGILTYCSDYRCSHSQAISGRLSDIQGRFTCKACGKRGADVRHDFSWKRRV